MAIDLATRFGDIEEALFRAGASRMDSARLTDAMIEAGSISVLDAGKLQRRGICPDIFSKELRAIAK